MPDLTTARIFISYSRKDGAKLAAKLRERLLDENFSVWQDLIALEAGRDWCCCSQNHFFSHCNVCYH